MQPHAAHKDDITVAHSNHATTSSMQQLLTTIAVHAIHIHIKVTSDQYNTHAFIHMNQQYKTPQPLPM
jgi:hypothetical protein